MRLGNGLFEKKVSSQRTKGRGKRHKFLAKSTSLPEIFSDVSSHCGGDFRSRAGQRKGWYADIGRTLETSDTAVRYVYMNGHENGRKSRKGTQQRVNEFFTNLPPKTSTSM